MNVTGPYWWLVSIGSGNGLVPSGNKSLPKPMLTQTYVDIWRHKATVIEDRQNYFNGSVQDCSNSIGNAILY